ncbi:uncharacterized protein FOMMEDRAFT_131470 [Fomitiporia mediterranea MF3/22]|uniref:uncharacterized protein n=1 Tax=Fomitiporia mediterranea (strain MF3/22) TaxID=694068 RepID=UPI000440912D|nr:uncharacterized protein FOMMEDRAFT_131470 [Fomitiporia mediterranea MF3/22]EJD06555.1 hypothetical protein FOMMEDRAFT_131470 [Fomitiporia mediterranea MF3/22]
MATQALPSFLSASTFTTVIGGVTQTQVETVVVSSVLPTQELPSFLSASTITATVGGVATTATTLVEVPLTYIGPSIPLGTNGIWTFLGSTTPASLQSSTATPSSSSSQTSSASSSSTGTPTESNPSSTTSSVPSASSSTAVAGAAGSRHHLTTGQLIGIIIAAVIAGLVIFLLFILFWFRRKRRRVGYEHPNLSDFVFVESSEGPTRVAGEGSPRPTGEEEDSFLRPSGESQTAAEEMQEIGPTARLVDNRISTATDFTTGTTMPPEGIVPTALKTPPASPSLPSGPKTPSPFFHASASSLFYNPSRGPDQSLVGAAVGAAKRDSASTRASSSSSPSGNAGKILTSRQLMEMDDQWRRESNGNQHGGVGLHHRPSELGERIGTPLRPPPVLGAAADTSSSRDMSSMRSLGSHPESPGSDSDERTDLLMAHRFNMSESGPAVLLQTDNEASTPSSWRSSLGLGLTGLARLSRLSWFQRMDAARRHSPESALPTTRSGSQLRSAETRTSLVVPRPVSHLTTSSTGETLYYDAPSGPSTMSTRSNNGNGHNRSHSQRPMSMPPLPPRALFASGEGGTSSAPQSPRPGFGNGSDSSSSLNRPALLLLDPPSGSAPASPRFPSPPPGPIRPHPQNAETRAEPVDVLDTPVPARAAVSPFSTTSSRGGPAVPPGLEHIANIRSWRDSSSDMPSSATFGTHSDRDVSVDVIGSGGDVLEEAPPMPTHNWTQLRAVTVTGTSESSRPRRALIEAELDDPHDDVHSAAASLHSIPDRLSPLSPMGSGSNSRAPSRLNNSSLGSSSSQFSRGPSPLGHGGNGNGNGTSGSSASQLAHSNSITSDGRRRPRREPGEPPAISPASSSHFGRARLSAIGGHRSPITTPQRSPGADASFALAQEGAMNEGTGAIIGRTR